MAGTVTLLGTQKFNTTSGTHTVVATPAVGDLIVILVANTGNTANVAPTDNNSDGAGGTGQYSRLNTCVKASSADTMQMWVRESKIGSASSTTFTHAPGTSTGGGLGVFKITGMNRAGLLALVQSAIQSNQAAAGTPTPVLGSAASTNNPLIGGVFNATNPATMTARSSPAYTERFDTGWATPTTGVETMSIDSGETGTSIAWGGTSASAFCSIIVELNAGAAPQATFLPLVKIRTARRINTTRRKRRSLLANDAYPPTPATSADRTLDAPFITKLSRSRKLQQPRDVIVSAQAAPSIPVAAWLVPARSIKRKRTHFWRRELVSPPMATIAPSPVLFIERPKVVKIRYDRKIIRQSPQLLYPPTTGPPVVDPSAWAAIKARRTSQARRQLQVAALPAFPETPRPEPNLAGRIPVGFKKLRRTKFRRLALKQLDSFPSTPAADAQPIAAWALQKAQRVLYAKARRDASPQPSFPATPTPPTDPLAAWRLVTPIYHADRRRRVLELPMPESTPATPPVPEQPFSAWKLVTPTYHADHPRKALAFPLPGDTPETPFVSPEPIEQPSGGWPVFAARYEQESAKRRKTRQEQEEREEETERIQNRLDREIAELLRKQEAVDERKAYLELLGALAKDKPDIEAARAYSDRVAVAYARAIAQQNYSALEALDRELQRAVEEEEWLINALILLIE